MAESNTSKPEHSRQHRRYAVKGGLLQVTWLAKTGRMRIARARILDVSEDGMALELPEPVMPLMVRFQSKKLKLEGKGIVCHCCQVGGKYVVGVKFAADLHWRAPGPEVVEPIPVSGPESSARGWLSEVFAG